MTKRIFDILFSLVALVALSPVLLFTAIAIKMESRGPVFYFSKRVGQFYQIFDLIKFRTMAVDADLRLNQFKHLNQYVTEQEPEEFGCSKCTDLGEPCSPLLFSDGKQICEYQYLKQKHASAANPFVKLQNDPRVTAVGRFIRKTSIDELPQLINILWGDMSLVGNRPLPLYEAELLTKDQSSERFEAPAGLTGLWQVTKRGKGEMSAEERIQLDVTYAREYSFWFDIKLMAKTVPALFQEQNV